MSLANGQSLIDAVRFVMRRNKYGITNCIDDIIGHELPSQADVSFQFLQNLLLELGFTISQSKLTPPSTKVTCLGVEINTTKFTISFPQDKLSEIMSTIDS